MALFDSLGKKITSATQNIVRGTKDLTDTARLNSLIADEERQIASLYSQIGKLYCDTMEHTAETALGNLCISVDAANDKIAKYNEQILEIKGTRHCPKCGADIPLNSGFCGVCGAKIEAPEKEAAPAAAKRFCSNCGAEIAEGLAFCTSCGHKVE